MPSPKRKILVFEDTESITTLLRIFFTRQNCEVSLMPDGADAVAAARAFGPDLIVMDYIMPGKDGIEAAMDLREAGVTAPILMLTSKSFDADHDRAKAAGINAYLTKPFDPKQLEDSYRSLLSP